MKQQMENVRMLKYRPSPRLSNIHINKPAVFFSLVAARISVQKYCNARTETFIRLIQRYGGIA